MLLRKMCEKMVSSKSVFKAKKSDAFLTPVEKINNPFVFFSEYPVTYYNVLQMLKTCYQEEKIDVMLKRDPKLKTIIYNYQLPSNKQLSNEALMKLLELRYESELDELFLKAIRQVYAYYFETKSDYKTSKYDMIGDEVLEKREQAGNYLSHWVLKKNDFSTKMYRYLKAKFGNFRFLTVHELNKCFSEEEDKEFLFEIFYKIGLDCYQTDGDVYSRICCNNGELVKPYQELFPTPQSIILCYYYSALPIFQNTDNRIGKYFEDSMKNLSTQQYHAMLKEEQEAFIHSLVKWEKRYLYRIYKEKFYGENEFYFILDELGVNEIDRICNIGAGHGVKAYSFILGDDKTYRSESALLSKEELDALHKKEYTTEEFYLKEKVKTKIAQLKKLFLRYEISMEHILENSYLDAERFKKDLESLELEEMHLSALNYYLSDDQKLRLLIVLSYYYMKEKDEKLAMSDIIKENMQWLFIEFDDFFNTPYFEDIYTKCMIHTLLTDEDIKAVFEKIINYYYDFKKDVARKIPYPVTLFFISHSISQEERDKQSTYFMSLLKKYENINIFEYVYQMTDECAQQNVIDLFKEYKEKEER